MKPIRIAQLFPEFLNLYGDAGNVRCLQKRCEWRDIPVEVVAVHGGDQIDLSQVDIIFIGGGPKREQQLAAEHLFYMKDTLSAYVESGGVLLAVGEGFQLLGKECVLAEEETEGLGLLDMVTKNPRNQEKRLIGNVAIRSKLMREPLVGYEDHSGRTYLGEGLDALGLVISSPGYGNNDTEKQEGALYKNLVGSYLHGPLLAKNPELTDYLLQKVFEGRNAQGFEAPELIELDDSAEHAANTYLLGRLSITG